jgi:arginyl-tRNA synthetase
VDPPEGHGELGFATFQWASALKRDPREIAAELAGEMAAGELLVAHESVGGYVNSRLDMEAFAGLTLTSILEGGSAYGSHPSRDVKILLEHTSVNPTGPMHVGRLRNAIIGDTLARLLRMAGYEVTTEYFVNDVGKQVVSLAWGVANLDEEDVDPPEREKPDHALVPYYRKVNEMMAADEAVDRAVAEEIVRLESGDEATVRRVREASQRVLDGILESLSAMGVEYDRLFRESDVVLDGRVAKVLDALRKLENYHEDDGAGYLDLEAFDLPTRDSKFYVTRSDGSTLYTTRDMAYHLDKFSRCDHAINVLGEDHKLEWRSLCAALELLGSDRFPEGLFYAFISLEEGRMSTRAGTVVAVDDLMDEAIARALEEVRKRREDLAEEEMEAIARFVGLGALRYNIVRVQPEKRIVFRWEEALNFEGDSAPFVQYAHARTCGILRKAGEPGEWDASALSHPQERALILALAKFPQTVLSAAEGRRPHSIAGYANDLAATLNQFYRDCPVLRAPARVREARLALVKATRTVLANCLESLGIAAPEAM